jgi:hypothetical protein
MFLLRPTAIWFLMLVLIILHGGARDKLLKPRIGELRAHQVSCFTGSLIILIVATLTIRWIGATGDAALIGIGAFWVALTFAFETFMVRVLMRQPWERVWADYNLARGRLWVLARYTPSQLHDIVQPRDFFEPMVGINLHRAARGVHAGGERQGHVRGLRIQIDGRG